MNRYVKISAALASFALLLVVIGLSTQGAVNAQAGTITTVPKYVCSTLPACSDTNTSVVTVTEGTATIKVTNLDVATLPLADDINPRTITLSGGQASTATLTVVQQFTDGDLPSDTPTGNQIRGFNGNRIQIEYRPADSNTFATYATITVDNVKPALVINAPAIPLVVKGSTDITFSADITDGGAGYTGDEKAFDGDLLTAAPGILPQDGGSTAPGGVRLVVAGNVVNLDKANVSAIDGGWNVWATINSSAIQSIGANTPWYFETRDRAGNTQRTSGSIALKPSAATNNLITVGRFVGNLQGNTFDGSQIKVTRKSDSVNLDITEFDNDAGAFTVTAPTDEPFTTTAVNPDDDFELLGSSLLTVDSKAPRLASERGAATSGIGYNSSTKKETRGLSGKANSIQIKFADDGKLGPNDSETVGGDTTDGPDGTGSGLDASSVVPGAFTVSGNTVNSVLVAGNTIYLTLAENLGPAEKPTISIAGGSITDKAGNAYGGERTTAVDGLGPNLSLSKSGDLSKEKVTVTISTDEQLSKLPTVTLGRVISGDGSILNRGVEQCYYAPVDDDPQTTEVDESLPEQTGPLVVAEGQDDTCAALAAPDSREGTIRDVPGQPPIVPAVRQTGAQTYTYAVTDTSIPENTNGGKYNVYVVGVDTQHTDNESDIGNKNGANNVGAFTFQLDTALNGGGDPIVKVGEAIAAGADADAPKVEAIDNLIVTVDFAKESGEYPGDSYRTVDLTLAELTITFKDGETEKIPFNLTTDVNSPDNIQFTLALLNPKVGNYSLKVKATDSAGNASTSAGHTSRWEVVSAKPVKIELQPGWNMISLPFQPGNPAINSVIKSTHPADIVMTFDGPTQTWLVSRRDAESGLFVGDIAVMTASTAYFVRTTNFQALSILRPPIATNAAPPPQIPALPVVKGWNLIPIVSNASPLPDEIPADEYFGTLANSGNAGWLKAITFNTLARTWEDVTPGTPEGETPEMVKRGKGYWLYATGDGVIIP